MAKVAQMKFKKGDENTHYFRIPTTSWSAGGKLWFAAKPAVDNDATDAAAVINKSFLDAVIVNSLSPFYVAGKTTYLLKFAPGDITGVSYTDGEKVKKYLGEFQFIALGQDPVSYPGSDDFIEVLIYADIKRGIV